MGTSENTEMGSCKIAEEMRTSLVLFVVFTTALAGKHYLIETGDTETRMAEGGNGGGVGDYQAGGGGGTNGGPGGAHCVCNCNNDYGWFGDNWKFGNADIKFSVCESCTCNCPLL